MTFQPDPIWAQAMRKTLAEDRIRMIAVHRYEEALPFLSGQERVDLVIVPLNGRGAVVGDLFQHIRERRGCSPPILLIIGVDASAEIAQALAAEADDFLYEPFRSQELRIRVKKLLLRKESAIKTCEQTELSLLHAQINSHFLYNTLNTIIGICPRDPRRAGELLQQLSIFLRCRSKSQDQARLVDIQEELELTRVYCRIPKARFGERLAIRFDVDESLKVLVPPLSIQPLVENAVEHGVTKRLEGGFVEISVQRGPGRCIVSVKDDGIGIPEKVREKLLQGPQDRCGVGLINIHQRLQRLYGSGLRIESEVDVGTRVSMEIPLPCG